ncbi:MAG: CHAP domain-containing protein [Angelakisella sp.]|nr:CHAP domain-containing protein [Angelakisella sp.]
MASNAVTKWNATSFFSKTNPLYPTYKGECTWYAWGRAHEATGTTKLPASGAGKWYGQATNFTRRGPDEIPLSYSIGCFAGHVVFIESVSTIVSSNTTYVTFSEANWYADERLSDGKYYPYPSGTDGEQKTLELSEFKARGTGAYLGCIVL